MKGLLVVKTYIILTTFLIFYTSLFNTCNHFAYLYNFKNIISWNDYSGKKKILKFSSQHRINVKCTVKMILTSHVSNEMAENGSK